MAKKEEAVYSVPLSKIINDRAFETVYLPDLPENIMISNAGINRPGLQFAGFYDHYEASRLQIIGKVEHLYLASLSAEERAKRLEAFYASRPVGVIYTSSLSIGEDARKFAEKYRVALLNSKNAWRILGQESFAYEVAQWYGWDVSKLCIFVPVGNAGNITAIMSGFLKMHALGIVETLPRIFGVQSEHADPVYRYYSAPEGSREWKPVQVQPSVAQAAMIGNPVSFPRVRALASRFVKAAGEKAFQVVQVKEQQIMDAMIQANRHGHIACTQGGECLAGLMNARALGLIGQDEHAVLDSTAHALKFSGFQSMYFENAFPPAYGITPDTALANRPELLLPEEARQGKDVMEFAREGAKAVVARLGLVEK